MPSSKGVNAEQVAKACFDSRFKNHFLMVVVFKG